MPEETVTVDQVVINEKIDALETLSRQHEVKIRDIQEVISCLRLITHRKGVYRKNPQTGEILTDATAEDLYTLWVPKATELLT